MSRKTAKRQTFALDGGTYMYRITEASIRRYEEQAFIDAYKKGTLYTRSSRGEYTLRGIRSLMVSARRELIGVAVAEPQQPVILHHRRHK